MRVPPRIPFHGPFVYQLGCAILNHAKRGRHPHGLPFQFLMGMKYFVMTHREAFPATKRHLPFFRRLGEVVLLSPLDSPVTVDGLECCHAGKSFHGFDRAEFSETNAQMLYRFADFFDIMLRYRADYYAMVEYDQIFLRQPVPQGGLTCCHLTKFHWQDHAEYLCDMFPVVPYIFTRSVLEKVAAVCRRYIKAETFQHGHADRWMAVVLEQEGIPWATLPGGFTSFNSLDFNAQKPLFAGALAAQPTCIHPVKTEAEFTWVADMLACIDPRFHAELVASGVLGPASAQTQSTSSALSAHPGKTLSLGFV